MARKLNNWQKAVKEAARTSPGGMNLRSPTFLKKARAIAARLGSKVSRGGTATKRRSGRRSGRRSRKTSRRMGSKRRSGVKKTRRTKRMRSMKRR